MVSQFAFGANTAIEASAADFKLMSQSFDVSAAIGHCGIGEAMEWPLGMSNFIDSVSNLPIISW